MKSSLFRKALKRLQFLSLAGMAAIGLNGCGGGGGAGADGEPQIAPSTLEGVTITFFDALSVKFFKLAGTAGNESGAGDFDGSQSNFTVGISDNGNVISNDVEVPVIVANVKYTYVKTAADTGRITLTWATVQRSAAVQALLSQTDYRGNQFFWDGDSNGNQTLTLDVLFVDQGGVVTTTATRVRGYQARLIRYNRPMGSPPVLAINSTIDVTFESSEVVFQVDGRPLPTNYQVEQGPTEPSGIVWENLQGRKILFDGTAPRLFVAYQSANGGLANIPTLDRFQIEDAGTMLVDRGPLGAEDILGGAGDFAYARTGGAVALFSIQYDLPGGGTDRIDYRLVFDALDGGTWTDLNGNSGFFAEDISDTNP